jgi:hypothetical protein
MVATAVAAVALASVAFAPALAMAETADATATPDTTATPSTSTTPSVPATAVPKPSKKLILTYRVRAAKRTAAFSASATYLRWRVTKLQLVATVAKRAGGDVAHIRSELTSASAGIKEARRLAKIAATDMRRVPWAANRNAALAKANLEWKLAWSTLETARIHKRIASKELWALVKNLGISKRVDARAFR